MAHFAELNPNNVVLRVIVVATEDNSDADGNEKEYIGAAFCERLLGGRWKQTSYNGNIRKNFASIGGTYDEQRDAFIGVKPYSSWVLNEDTCKWEAPTPQPNGLFTWDESTQAWT
jgi:hypothetical protein